MSRTVQGIAATGGASTATNVTYNKTNSGLNAENAQDAIDEVSSKLIYDVSARNNGAVFDSLSALLSSSNLNTLIPLTVRHGGMSIRFIQGSASSSDNKYVQARLMANSFNTNINKWQSEIDAPVAGSKDLVESGGVFKFLTDYSGIYVSAGGNQYAEVDIPTSIASDYDNNGLVVKKQVKFKLPIMFANQTVKLIGKDENHVSIGNKNISLNANAEGNITPIGIWHYIRFNVGAEGNVVQIFKSSSMKERLNNTEQRIGTLKEELEKEIIPLNKIVFGVYTSAKGDINAEVDIPTSIASDYDSNGFIVGKKVYFKMPISYASQTISVRGRASDHSSIGSTGVSLDENAIGYVVVNGSWYYIRFVVGIGNTMQVYSEPLKDMVIKNKESIEELNVKEINATRKLVSGASTSNTVFGDALQLKDIEPELKYTTVYPNGNYQGITIYDNKIFAFNHGGNYKVSNLSDGTLIYTGSLVTDNSFHCGSVDFLKNHLSSADKPLFFISWNNRPRADFYELNSDQSSTFVMYVTYNGTAIKNLTQGSAFAYDENNGIVYMVARWNGNIMSNKNKTDLTIFAFRVGNT